MMQGILLKNERDLEAIRERGELRLITSYNSTGYFVYKDIQMGFEYELALQLAKFLGVKLKIILVQDPKDLMSFLYSGKGDFIAYHLPVVNLPANRLVFSDPYIQTEQVLVQLRRKAKDTLYVPSKNYLAGKTVSVPENSSFLQTLQELNFELSNKLHIETIGNGLTSEDLVKKVAEQQISYTVTNKEIAYINKGYYPELDIETSLTPPQDIAFGLHKRSKKLVAAINDFIKKEKKNGQLYALYGKYFQNSRYLANDETDAVIEQGDGTFISQYDPLIRYYAREINWDWRLLAALIWQESRFKPQARSWAGASGLMQLMPGTARRFGLYSMQEIYTPELNIKTGTKYISYLFKYWENIPEPNERLKFIIASYNAGEGHVSDASRLAKKYGHDPLKWDGNVEVFLLNKSNPYYYRDPVCKYGYCRGSEPFNYVKKIVERYQHYKKTVKAEENMPVFDLQMLNTREQDFEYPFFNSRENAVKNGPFQQRPVFEEKQLFKEKPLSKGTVPNAGSHNTLNVKPNKSNADTLIPKKDNTQPKKQLFQQKSPFKKEGEGDKYYNNLTPKSPK